MEKMPRPFRYILLYRLLYDQSAVAFALLIEVYIAQGKKSGVLSSRRHHLENRTDLKLIAGAPMSAALDDF